MVRYLVLSVCTLGLLGGCAQPQWPTEAPKKPSPAPEMAKLSRFIGTWSGSAEMVEPSPEDADEMPESFAGGGTMEWAFDGMALTGEGWYERGPDEKVHYVEYWSWDPKAKRYRIWSMSDWGETGSGWMKFDPDGNTMRGKFTAHDAEGNKKGGCSTMTFVDDNTMDWTYTEKSRMGKMKFKGTSRRNR